jgi:hypothetical protein
VNTFIFYIFERSKHLKTILFRELTLAGTLVPVGTDDVVGVGVVVHGVVEAPAAAANV